MRMLSVVGLGKLGVCSAACLAYRGFSTLGLDINPDIIAAVNAGQAPVYEPRLQELITAAGARLRATDDYRALLDQSDTTFFIVPTPSRDDGHFSDEHLQDAVRGIADALAESAKPYHLFVITSTVSPGTIERTLIPLIERTTGRRLNDGFGVCYSPEFIALGSVIHDFLNPDLVLIGESNPAAGDRLEAIYRRVCENRPYVARMSIVSAEITKLSLNSYVTMKISFANTLAAISEAIPGAQIDAITQALGADRRVSPHGLRGGMPYGGPCFPRDNRAFAAFARQFGVDASLAQATDDVNRALTRRLIDLVVDQLEKANADTASILGVAYKPQTPVIEESPAIAIIDALLAKDVVVTAYDPLADDAVRGRYGDRVYLASSVRDAVGRSTLSVIGTPAPDFAAIDDSYLAHNPAIIVDCWRVVDPRRFTKPVTYVAVGRPHV